MISDVFTTSEVALPHSFEGPNGDASGVQEMAQEEDEDEQVADILLGYTKTPAPVHNHLGRFQERSSALSVSPCKSL